MKYRIFSIYLCFHLLLSFTFQTAASVVPEQDFNRAEALELEASNYSQSGKYDAAIQSMTSALDIYKRVLGTDNTGFAFKINRLASFHFLAGKYEIADSLFRRALKIQETELGPTHLNVANTLTHLGKVEKARQEFAAAEQSFTRALRILEAKPETPGTELAAALNELAIFYHTTNQNDRSVPLLKRAISILESTLKADPYHLALYWQNLGNIYRVLNQATEAIRCFQRALEIQEKFYPGLHPEMGRNFSELAQLFYLENQYAQSEIYFQKLLQLNEQKLGKQHHELIPTLNNLANLCLLQQKDSVATIYFERVIQLTAPADSLELYQALDVVGQVAYEQKDFKKAKSCLKRALKPNQIKLGQIHPNVANIFYYLGLIAFQEKQFPPAKNYFQQAYDIREKNYGAGHSSLMPIEKNLALIEKIETSHINTEEVETKIGQTADSTQSLDFLVLGKEAERLKSENHLVRADSIYQILLTRLNTACKPDDPRIPNLNDELGNLRVQLRNYYQAEIAYQKSLELRQKYLKADHPDLAVSLSHLGKLKRLQGNLEFARKYYEQALEIREKNLGAEHPEVALDCNYLGTLFADLKQLAAADSLLSRALAIDEKHFPAESERITLDLKNLLTIKIARNDHAAAVDLSTRLTSILKKHSGADDPGLIPVLNQQARLFTSQGYFHSAEQVYEQIIAIQEKAYGPQDTSLAGTLLEFAKFYTRQERFIKVEPLIKRALTIYLNAVVVDSLQFAAGLFTLADFHIRQQIYSEAEPLLFQSMQIFENKTITNSLRYTQILRAMGIVLMNTNQAEQALSYLNRSRDIQYSILPQGHAELFETQYQLCLLYFQLNQNEEAAAQLLLLFSIQEKMPDSGNNFLLRALHLSAAIQNARGNFREAEATVKRILDTISTNKGQSSIEFANALKEMAILKLSQAEYADAEKYAEGARAIFQRNFPVDNPKILPFLNLLVQVHRVRGHTTAAVALQHEINALLEYCPQTEKIEFATNLYQIGMQDRHSGKFNEAKSAFLRAKTLFEAAGKIGQPGLARVLNELGRLYNETGEYQESEVALTRVLTLLQELFGNLHPEVANCLNDLAILSINLGRFADAENYYSKALGINRTVLGPDHPTIAGMMNNLAERYRIEGEFSRAEPLYLAAIKIYQKNFRDVHPSIAVTFSNLALLRMAQKRFDAADSLYQQAFLVIKQLYGEKHVISGTFYHNLAGFYEMTGQMGKAESFFEKAWEIRKLVLGPDHPDLSRTIFNLARMKTLNGDFSDALPLMTQAMLIEEQTIEKAFAASSEREKFIFLNLLQQNYEFYLNLVWQLSREKPKAVAAGFDAILRRKGLVIETLARERKMLLENETPEAREIANDLRQISSKLATLSLATTQTGDSLSRRISALGAQKEQLEKGLARLSHDFAIDQATRRADCQAVAAKLPEGSALVEFVSFRRFLFDHHRWSQPIYLAYVLPAGKNARPKLIELGAADQIDHQIHLFRREMADAAIAIWSNGEQQAEKDLAGISQKLYRLVFLPLEKELRVYKVIYLAPDGDLNLVPMGVLQDTTNVYLGERFQFNYLSSGRDLISAGQTQDEGKNVFLVANPDYDFQEFQENNQLQPATPFFAMRGANDLGGSELCNVKWPPLPNTEIEVRQIAQIMEKDSCRLYLNQQAEESVVKQQENPRILHVATHGFFLEEQTRMKSDNEITVRELDRGFIQMVPDSAKKPEQPINVPAPEKPEAPITTDKRRIENPLLRSGIVLAGANQLGKIELPPDAEDGILTAFEICSLPLSGTELVVLSACETGVGETRRGEGVFGLRRAFQMAGAQTVVMSLWKVPDKETQELMVDFYQRLRRHESKSGALQNAQLSLLRARRAEQGATHPFFWGAFVCVGDVVPAGEMSYK